MNLKRLQLNAVLVLLIGLLSIGTAPNEAAASAVLNAMEGCGVCWSGLSCPTQWQRDHHCTVLCGEDDAGSCLGELFSQLYECNENQGWECSTDV
jgi:hypothetical protein